MGIGFRGLLSCIFGPYLLLILKNVGPYWGPFNDQNCKMTCSVKIRRTLAAAGTSIILISVILNPRQLMLNFHSTNFSYFTYQFVNISSQPHSIFPSLRKGTIEQPIFASNRRTFSLLGRTYWISLSSPGQNVSGEDKLCQGRTSSQKKNGWAPWLIIFINETSNFFHTTKIIITSILYILSQPIWLIIFI